MNFAEANECFKAETDLFSTQPTQTNVEDGSWQAVGPGANYETGTIEFNVAATEEYLDLSQTELYLKVSIRKRDSNDINSENIKDDYKGDATDNDNVGPVNNFFHSIFNQIVLTLNNTQIENSNGSYAYRAYIENLLNYGKDAKESHLISNMFIKDEAYKLDVAKAMLEKTDYATKQEEGSTTVPVPKTGTSINMALLQRRHRFIKNKSVEMMSQLHIDLFNTNRYMLNRTPFKLTLNRSKDEFSLMGVVGTKNYIVYVEKAILFLRKVKLAPSIMDSHIISLQSQNALYPIRRVVVKMHLIPNNIESYLIDNVFTGKMPRRVVIGLVEHAAVNGNYKLNPFNFQHFNLASLKLLIAGHALPYRDGIELDYDKDNYIRGYNTLFKGVNGSTYENGNDISYADYAGGYALYAFNLTPDQCDSEHFSLAKTGDVEIELKFREATKKPLTAVIYLEFDNMIQITNLRQVITDYKI